MRLARAIRCFFFVALCALGAHDIAFAQADTPSGPEKSPEQSPEKLPEKGAPDQAPDEVSGADQWDNAPKPDQASGIEKGLDKGDGLLWVPRVLFFIPRWAFYAVMSPVRLGAYLYEKYQLTDRFDRLFFNDTGTMGLFPVVAFDSNFGYNFGLRFIHKNLFKHREQFRLRASYGGRFRQLYSGSLTSGDRFGSRVELSLLGDLEIRPKETFFGIGNGDEVDDDTVTAPTHAIHDDVATFSRFRQRVTRGVVRADFSLGGPLHLRLSGHLMYRSFGSSNEFDDDEYIENFYQRDSLIGFDKGLSNLYSEVELRYDSRRKTSEYLSNAVPATGWLLTGFAGHASGLGDDPSDYVRAGVDLQRYINLYRGTRILMLRVFVENLFGELDEIPFVDLPPLGGALLLRGYAVDRFRDRAAAVASMEYSYDLGPNFAGVLFADTGGVFRKLRDAEFDDLRLGFGGGVQVHTRNSYMARFHIASSIDGGLFFNLSFDPVYDTRTRAGRY